MSLQLPSDHIQNFNSALEHVRALETEAKQAYAAFIRRRDELAKNTDQAFKMTDEHFAELTRLQDASDLASFRAEEAAAKIGLGRNRRPIPGGGARGAVGELQDYLSAHPDAMSAPTGAVVVSSLIETALSLPHTGGSGFQAALDGGNLYAPNRGVSFGVVELPRRRLSVLDLIPIVGSFPDELGGAVLEYYKHTVRTNAAATVAALSQKPESVLTISRESTSMWTYAHISEAVPLQFLTRNDGLQAYIESDMAMSVMEAHEADILSGTGTTEVDGLTHVSGTLTQASTGDPIADIRKAKTQLDNANIVADALVLNPSDAEKIDLATDGDGQYFTGGPLSEATPRLWRVPVVVSTGLSAGTAILGAFRLGAVRWTGGSRLEWGRINTDLQYNQLRLVAEAGASAAVTRPGAFVKVTIA